MKKMLFIFSFIVLSQNLFALGKFEVKKHIEVFQYIAEQNYKSSETLIVYDIDNTLLKTSNEFGSDQWFNWQSKQVEASSSNALAKSFNELIEVQNQVFTLGKTQLVENEIIGILDYFKKNKISMIALTSRSPSMRDVTFRELARHQISFDSTKIGLDLFPEFIISNPNQNALYQAGVFMTSGMNKGEMIKYLLAKFNSKFANIIFIDDHERHTNRVYEALAPMGINIDTFRYGHEDENVQTFNLSDKVLSIKLGQEFITLKNQMLN